MVSPSNRDELSVELHRDCAELADLFGKLQTDADVAEILEVPIRQLRYILYGRRRDYAYRTFEIAKRNGAVRQISEPPPSIKILQRKLLKILYCVYRPRIAAHGFVPGRSILTNARVHTGKRFVLNLDLKGFFPAIHFGRVQGALKAPPYKVQHAAATVLADLCCNERELPQGAPTSPIIANIVSSKLDSDLLKLCRDARCTYSRYADDITISTTQRGFPAQLATAAEGGWSSGAVLSEPLVSVIRANGFEVNHEKTRMQTRGRHQEVTGLTVNQFPNLRKSFVRNTRAMIHNLQMHGLEAVERDLRERDGYYVRDRNPDFGPPSFQRVLRGRLDLIKMVKGEGDQVYRRLRAAAHGASPELIGPVSDVPMDFSHTDEGWDFFFRRYEKLVYQLEVHTDDGDVFAVQLSGTALRRS